MKSLGEILETEDIESFKKCAVPIPEDFEKFRLSRKYPSLGGAYIYKSPTHELKYILDKKGKLYFPEAEECKEEIIKVILGKITKLTLKKMDKAIRKEYNKNNLFICIVNPWSGAHGYSNIDPDTIINPDFPVLIAEGSFFLNPKTEEEKYGLYMYFPQD